MRLQIMRFLCLIPLVTQYCYGEEHVISQKDKQFSQESIVIKAGDSIRFYNADPFYHNIYSFSVNNSFDLGSFPRGESKKVTFDKKGKRLVECALHANMKLLVVIE